MFINNQNLLFASDCKLQIGFLQMNGYLAQNWLFTLFGMDTWPVFVLISYSALHASISLNMASNDDMMARISAAVSNALRNSQFNSIQDVSIIISLFIPSGNGSNVVCFLEHQWV